MKVRKKVALAVRQHRYPGPYRYEGAAVNNLTCNGPECERPAGPQTGLCEMHAQQIRRGRALKPLVKRGQTLEQRFWAKVDKTGECWTWTAAQTSTGYGVMGLWVDGKTVMKKAHRLALELSGAEVPSNMVVDHLCHTPLCVRPSHLRVVTNKRNMENRAGLNSNNKTGVRGVHWSERYQQYIAQVKHNGEHVLHERHDTLEAAEAAAIAKRLEVFRCNDADRRAAA